MDHSTESPLLPVHGDNQYPSPVHPGAAVQRYEQVRTIRRFHPRTRLDSRADTRRHRREQGRRQHVGDLHQRQRGDAQPGRTGRLEGRAPPQQRPPRIQVRRVGRRTPRPVHRTLAGEDPARDDVRPTDLQCGYARDLLGRRRAQAEKRTGPRQFQRPARPDRSAQSRDSQPPGDLPEEQEPHNPSQREMALHYRPRKRWIHRKENRPAHPRRTGRT